MVVYNRVVNFKFVWLYVCYMSVCIRLEYLKGFLNNFFVILFLLVFFL